MADLNRSLVVMADGRRVKGFRRANIIGKDSLGLFPQPFLLRLWNLPEDGYYALYSAKEISVLSGDAVLAYGKVSDVYCRTVSEGTITEAVFSPGLALWEAQISLSIESGVSVSEVVRRILSASGLSVSLISFPSINSVFSRPQAFYGRAAECILEALSPLDVSCFLAPAGLCVIPASGPPESMMLSEADLINAPVRLPGNRMILKTRMAGWALGKMISVSWRKVRAKGLILERSVNADNMEGKWEAELLLRLKV